MEIRKSIILERIISQKRGENFDVAVMYSGGKDSAFLIHLLKNVYNLRVKAVAVDNGFENENMWKAMSHFTEANNIPLEIIRPNKEVFCELYRVLVEHQHVFHKEKTNHLCFICNNLLWASVVEYADRNNIPFVASGLSLAQLSSGRKHSLNPDKFANSIAEKSTQMIFLNAYNNLKGINDSNINELLLEYFNKVNVSGKKVTTIYPYIYHEISVEDLKSKISQLGWTPPSEVSIEKYVSSGCMIMRSLVYELEKIGIITLNEREQAKVMINKGQMSEEQLNFALYDASKDVVNLQNPIFDELNIKEYLISKCKERNKVFTE
ncbi:hypothetical protein [Inconstantimicrobium mannanitabidum]|uniref:hypothetical protein n=1 Tax=Inconstantimicrobium mannanitabidum TaxID=1604901 RepID=UPI0021C29783|nr:hypothetical protein [Clostridium sp. TW13]